MCVGNDTLGSQTFTLKLQRQRAEVIVVVEHELRIETAEASQKNEGLIRQLADVSNSTGIGQKRKPCLKRNRVKQNRKYRPQSILGVEIPKSSGKTRLLGIPTLIDRMPQQAARKAGNTIYLFLRDKLKLPINREKSSIRRPVGFEILGYKFVPTYVKGEKGKYQLVVSDKSWKTLKQNLKTLHGAEREWEAGQCLKARS